MKTLGVDTSELKFGGVQNSSSSWKLVFELSSLNHTFGIPVKEQGCIPTGCEPHTCQHYGGMGVQEPWKRSHCTGGEGPCTVWSKVNMFEHACRVQVRLYAWKGVPVH